MLYLLMLGAIVGSVIGSLAASSITGASPLPAVIFGAVMGFFASLSLAAYMRTEKGK